MVAQGIKTRVVAKEMAMPLERTYPISGPMRNCMAIRAAKPITVVRPLEAMEPAERSTAWAMASSGWRPSLRNSSNRSSRKMA